MNIMRKLRGGTAATTGETTNESPPDSPHTQLGLMHLKKLFNEYTHPKEPLSEIDRDYKLYTMLPLFCKVSFYLNFSIFSFKFMKKFRYLVQVMLLK